MAFSFLKGKRKEQKTINNLNIAQKDKIAQGRKELAIVMEKLAKENGIDLSQLAVRIAVCMDHSGTMIPEYDNGTVQEVLDMIFPFAILLDDNKSMEVFLFDDTCKQMDTDMNMQNYNDYVKKEIINKRYPYGGTRYAPAIRKIDRFYNDKESNNIPTLVFFITDGANFDSDKEPCDFEIVNSSDHGAFYMFIGVGSDTFSYLRHLDDIKGREHDHTGFMHFKDFASIQNIEMFTQSLKDFIPWLHAKGYIR